MNRELNRILKALAEDPNQPAIVRQVASEKLAEIQSQSRKEAPCKEQLPIQ